LHCISDYIKVLSDAVYEIEEYINNQNGNGKRATQIIAEKLSEYWGGTMPDSKTDDVLVAITSKIKEDMPNINLGDEQKELIRTIADEYPVRKKEFEKMMDEFFPTSKLQDGDVQILARSPGVPEQRDEVRDRVGSLMRQQELPTEQINK